MGGLKKKIDAQNFSKFQNLSFYKHPQAVALFYPTPSKIQDSYKSYLQVKFECMVHGSSLNSEAEPDAHCPSLVGNEHIKCELCGNRMVFASKSMATKHTLFCHSNAKRALQANPSEHVCKFDGCFLAFPSYYQLNKHKKAENHQIKRGRKARAND